MPFLPHTQAEIAAMLAAVGATSVDELFDAPATSDMDLPAPLSEMALLRLAGERGRGDEGYLNFIGAGAYEHHIPAAVWHLARRGEFLTAYTPYQAEASQGTLQAIYEFQSMMAALTAMEVANASLYDGATALAEAVLMAVRLSGKRRILMPGAIHPHWRQTVETLVAAQGIAIDPLPFCTEGGDTAPEALDRITAGDVAAVVIPQANFFGVLEDTDELVRRTHARGWLAIAVVDPVLLGLLLPPGEWGERGADIAVGEGQPLGIPLSSGGPYLGFLCTRKEYVRQMPGRLVGRTTDIQGREGFTLTLQAREQHIRRAKATSNICTNQGLMATAATIHLALLGPEGLRRTAAASHTQTRKLVEALTSVEGVELLFSEPFFHEAVISFDVPADEILRALSARGILGGLSLAPWFPALGNTLLVCATETRSDEDIARYAEEFAKIISRRSGPACTRLKPGENSKW